MMAPARPQKITFAEMRWQGVRGPTSAAFAQSLLVGNNAPGDEGGAA